MLNTKFQCCAVLALAALSAGSAMAATTQLSTTAGAAGSYYISSSMGAMAFDSTLIGAMGYVGVDFTGVAPATYDAATTTVGTTVSGMGFDNTTNKVTSLGTIGGGAFTMAKATSILGIAVGGPGSISFTDLAINLATSTVSAHVVGTNGVTTGNYDIFTFSSYTGSTSFTGAGAYSFSATGLALTTTGVDLITKGLKLSAVGTSVLGGVTNLGAMTGNLTVAKVPVAAVPEPESYLLMGLGFIGLAFARKRVNAS
jgi:hypothetical protein